MTTIIETPRMLLRKFTLADVPATYEYNSNPEVQKYTGDELVSSLERAEEIMKDVVFKDYETYGYGRLAAVYKPENKVIGFAGFKYLPFIEDADIGFRFLPKYWGQGIATEVSHALVKYGFETMKLPRIIGIAYPDNIGSCKVLEKIGLTFYKMDEYEGDGGNYRWYKMEAAEYESLQNG